MRSHLLEAYLHTLHVGVVYPGSVPELGEIARRRPQPGFKLGLEVGSVLAEEGLRELQDA